MSKPASRAPPPFRLAARRAVARGARLANPAIGSARWTHGGPMEPPSWADLGLTRLIAGGPLGPPDAD
jgi:hypothetical protein